MDDIPDLKQRSADLPLHDTVTPTGAAPRLNTAQALLEQDLDGFDDGLSANDILEVKAANALRAIERATPFWPSMFS